MDEVIDDPLNQGVLDPACGSGTFLFRAVQRHLDAAYVMRLISGRGINDGKEPKLVM